MSQQIIDTAKQHLKTAAPGASPVHAGNRWGDYLYAIQRDIDSLVNVRDIMIYAHDRVGFDHRRAASSEHPYIPLYENTLELEFPHYSQVIMQMSDSLLCDPSTLLIEGRRIISNIFYVHLRSVLQCLTYFPTPGTICEIGGGYGATARLWLENPIHRPDLYVIIDFPECLFFSEVFLRANFGDSLETIYLTDSSPIKFSDTDEQCIIFCPISCVGALSRLFFDLVINTGSLQEMTEAAVDFWMDWLENQNCRYFYSLNYFAIALALLGEAANTWSPRLPRNWIVRLQRLNPPLNIQQSFRNWAEILAEKQDEIVIEEKELAARYEFTKQIYLDNSTFLEAMDIVRMMQHEDIVWDLLLRCTSEMAVIPKEASYLVQYLTERASPGFRRRNGIELENLLTRLQAIRSHGQEDVLDNRFPPAGVQVAEQPVASE